VTNYAMVIDLEKCLGCEACAAACIAENRRMQALSLAERAAGSVDAYEKVRKFWLRTRVTPVYVGRYPFSKLVFMHNICLHCDNAPCVAACPTGATYQRPDGIVLVDPKKCLGCQYCVYACPYGARTWDPEINHIDKCTFCEHLLAEGQPPACVQTCPAHARIFGDLEDPDSEVSRIVRNNKNAVRLGTEWGSKARVYFVVKPEFRELAANPKFPDKEEELEKHQPQYRLAGWGLVGLTILGLAGHIIYWSAKKGEEGEA
jgi:Fe-S-cluster-containing dehydrogenase component